MSTETLKLYAEWFKQLTHKEIYKIIGAALGEDATKHELLIEKIHSGLTRVYIGLIGDGNDKLRADTNCPYFDINERLHIGFYHGSYATNHDLLSPEAIKKIEEGIDRMSAYACLNGIVTRHSVEV